MDFRSDNTAAICPELMDAMVQANQGQAPAYGADAFSAGLDALFSAFFETPVRAFMVPTGTAGNALALATLCPPWGSILCHREAHIERDECGAPEFFSGAKLSLIDGPGALISRDALAGALRAFHPMVHMVQPKLLSLTQANERGRCYAPDDIAALAEVAHKAGLAVHMDGARFANALVALQCKPADITWRAGVDVLSFGATKNGGYACEAVIFFDAALVQDFEYRRKRGGHLGCKSRFAAAQWHRYLRDDVWRIHAAHANRCATRIAEAGARFLTTPPQTNQLFLRLPAPVRAQLTAQGFLFYDWGDAGSDEIRLVTSWQTKTEEVEALRAALSAIA
jgi:threonine aldolase